MSGVYYFIFCINLLFYWVFLNQYIRYFVQYHNLSYRQKKKKKNRLVAKERFERTDGIISIDSTDPGSRAKLCKNKKKNGSD